MVIRLFSTLLTAAAVLALAAPVEAATVERNTTDQTIYTAGPGEQNALTVDDQGTPGSELVFTDAAGVTIAPTPPCYRPGAAANVAVCPATYSIDVLLGDRDDSANAGDLAFGYPLFRGDEGDDRLVASTGGASLAMHGGEGRDEYVGGPGFDSVGYPEKTAPLTASLDGLANDPDGENVPPDIDALGGGEGDDTVIGSPEADYLFGGGGDDFVRGMAGNDDLAGGDGDDRLEAGDGNDVFTWHDPGADDISGGDGFDRFEIVVDTVNFGEYPASRPADFTISLNDVADDGRFGEGDNVRSDIEDVGPSFSVSYSFRLALSGDGDFNVLTGGLREDRLEGGPGSDRIVARDGDDTILARDGLMDRIECGGGADTAIVDPLDELADCETVDRAAPAGADPPASAPPPDDRPPTIAFTTPREDTLVGAPTTVTVDARDDRAVSRVLLFDDGRVVATDTTAPYTFPYVPEGDDVGRKTLVAVAVDSAEQTGTAVRPVRIDRFRPGIRRTVSPARDRRAPYRFRVAGSLTLPAGVTRAQACSEGEASIQIKRGTRTISTRRARLDGRCAFSSSVVFRDRTRLGRGRLKATVRFLGNDVLRPRTARPVAVRAG